MHTKIKNKIVTASYYNKFFLSVNTNDTIITHFRLLNTNLLYC